MGTSPERWDTRDKGDSAPMHTSRKNFGKDYNVAEKTWRRAPALQRAGGYGLWMPGQTVWIATNGKITRNCFLHRVQGNRGCRRIIILDIALIMIRVPYRCASSLSGHAKSTADRILPAETHTHCIGTMKVRGRPRLFTAIRMGTLHGKGAAHQMLISTGSTPP